MWRIGGVGEVANNMVRDRFQSDVAEHCEVCALQDVLDLLAQSLVPAQAFFAEKGQ
jgi:hypothetical protein